jgi:hypothetical protein
MNESPAVPRNKPAATPVETQLQHAAMHPAQLLPAKSPTVLEHLCAANNITFEINGVNLNLIN